jgi:HPr kinase/phosphorylase
MYCVEQMFTQHAVSLHLVLRAGARGMHRPVSMPEVQRPGIHLAGRFDHYTGQRILVFGRSELAYISSFSDAVRAARFRELIAAQTPAVIVARDLDIPEDLLSLCEEQGVPLFSTDISATEIVSKLTFLLYESLNEMVIVHATLMEIFGLGVLLRGQSSIGKSETALNLVKRGHLLIADDVVCLRHKKDNSLEGTGPELTRHVMEIRGIGILDIALLNGSVCVSNSQPVSLIVQLEEWHINHLYDRVGLTAHLCTIQGVLLPKYTLPMKPGLSIALLVETIARMHKIRLNGCPVLEKEKNQDSPLGEVGRQR